MQFLFDLSNNNIKNTQIDIISCNMNSNGFINEVNKLNTKYNINIDYSLDKTGNYNSGDDWIMESSGKNIKYDYFTDNINQWNYVLDPPIIDNTNVGYFFIHLLMLFLIQIQFHY
jgi:hypothetical protein